MIHAHSYKHPLNYRDKTVVVVGIGNSAVDIAIDLSKIAKQVYISTRRGAWVYYRVEEQGRPWDLSMSRANKFLKDLAPSLYAWVMERKLQKRFDHETYGLKPAFRYNRSAVTLNDDLPNRIICGEIVVKPNIRRFTETGVIFADGTRVERVDEVIFATGYRFSLPLLENGKLVPVVSNESDLYKYIYPPETSDHNTLGLIGHSSGAFMPIFELQARVFFEALAGNIHLPGKEEMLADIMSRRDMLKRRYQHTRRHAIMADVMEYMDELGAMIGAKPDPLSYMLTDPQLAYKLLFGPSLPYSFRMAGPNPWDGARQAILDVEKR
ncbi:Protein FMO-5, partial [Aphelenchoides avenae]